jgi:hypothetical protein
MHRNVLAAVSALALTTCLVGCGASSQSTCGVSGQACCLPAATCNTGLACQSGACLAGADPCGASGQSCCATGAPCATGLACQDGTCATVQPVTATKTICAAGGSLAVAGATLTLPQGALTSCTRVSLSTSSDPVPTGYTGYSPVFQLEPAGLEFATPASLSIAFTGDPGVAALFWSRQGTTGYERLASSVSNGAVTAEISHFSQGFVANGEEFVDAPDGNCVVSRLVEGRTMSPSTVALFFTVDDCWGRPFVGLTQSDFSVLENGSAISPAESSATILQRNGLQVFASLLIDMSESTTHLLPSVIQGAKAFVNKLQVEKSLPVHIDIQLFAGEATVTEWQAPTLDTATLLSRLDALTTFTPADRRSTNLNGAVVEGLTRIAAAEAAFRDRNYGGAFTTGYLVLFTDGKDTAARVTESAVTSAEGSSPDQAIAVGLQSLEYDPVALGKIAPNGVITAADEAQLSTAFATLANRMEGQISRSYLLGYCSPKRAGTTNTVSVEVLGATNESTASYKFDASAFAPGCTTDTFATLCDGKQCGGLGCGACDDRVASCDQATSMCVAN